MDSGKAEQKSAIGANQMSGPGAPAGIFSSPDMTVETENLPPELGGPQPEDTNRAKVAAALGKRTMKSARPVNGTYAAGETRTAALIGSAPGVSNAAQQPSAIGQGLDVASAESTDSETRNIKSEKGRKRGGGRLAAAVAAIVIFGVALGIGVMNGWFWGSTAVKTTPKEAFSTFASLFNTGPRDSDNQNNIYFNGETALAASDRFVFQAAQRLDGEASEKYFSALSEQFEAFKSSLAEADVTSVPDEVQVVAREYIKYLETYLPSILTAANLNGLERRIIDKALAGNFSDAKGLANGLNIDRSSEQPVLVRLADAIREYLLNLSSIYEIYKYAGCMSVSAVDVECVQSLNNETLVSLEEKKTASLFTINSIYRGSQSSLTGTVDELYKIVDQYYE